MQKVSSDGEGSDLNDFDSDRDIPRWAHYIVSVVSANAKEYLVQLIVQKMLC